MASSYHTGRVAPEHVQYSDQFDHSDSYDDGNVHYQEDIVAQGAGGLGRMVNLLGAVGSLALLVGVGVWGYKLIIRDVSGVPVVRAVEGPMRIQPESPGGTPADHQGLAVNTVAAKGTAAPPPDRLILAPRPVSLSDEDAPMGDLRPTPAVLVVEEEVSNHEAAGLRQDAVDALVSELGGEVEAAPVEPEPEVAIDPADLIEQTPQVALLDEPGVAKSLRPNRRPKGLASAGTRVASLDVRAAVDAALEQAAALDVDPATLPVGTRLAQLGAFESAEVAQAEWDRLYGRFSDYMNGKQRVIQKATSGGRTFYRLRALGFDDLSDSRRFCAALVAEGADCIPVTVR